MRKTRKILMGIGIGAAAIAVVLAGAKFLTTKNQTQTDDAVASTIRLQEAVGTVGVSNLNGKSIPTIPDMKLYNGYQVETQAESYAYLSLDDTKAVKMNEVAVTEIRQHNKDLEVILKSGELFFNVSKPLEADEHLNIRASTMITGIRGTSGIVRIVNDAQTELLILDGVVQCKVLDPITGAAEEKSVGAGQKARIFVYKGQNNEKKVDILLDTVDPQEIPGYVLQELAKDSKLVNEILRQGGPDVRELLAGADQRLQEDQQKTAEDLIAINQAFYKQGKKIITDSVFEESSGYLDSIDALSISFNPDPDPDNNSISEQAASSSPEPESSPVSESDSYSGSVIHWEGKPVGRKPIVLAMPITAAELNRHLVKNDVTLMNTAAIPGAASGSEIGAESVLEVDAKVTVPSGGYLTIGSDIDVQVKSGNTLQVDGTLATAGSITNYGTIANTGTHTLIISGVFDNFGALNNTGRLEILGAFRNDGTVTSTGAMNIVKQWTNAEEGSATISGTLNQLPINAGALTVDIAGADYGSFTNNGGTASITARRIGAITVTGGTYTQNAGTAGQVSVTGGEYRLAGGTVENGITVDGATLSMSGGSVSAITADAAVSICNEGTATLTGGTIYTVGKTTLQNNTGTIMIESGVTIQSIISDPSEFFENEGGTWFYCDGPFDPGKDPWAYLTPRKDGGFMFTGIPL